ncbi:MAG: putative sulfate exporter family transporter [Nocardioidaceae bacterium]
MITALPWSQRLRSLPSLLVALLVALIAWAISAIFPLASPIFVALVLGAVVANTDIADHAFVQGHGTATKFLLRLGVVFLGLKLPIQDILGIGAQGLAVVALTVVVTYSLTVMVGDRLGLDKGLVTLVAAGFSICGAAAIAAIDDTIRAKQRDVALAVAMVTVFGSAMIVLVPWLSALIGLTDQQAAVWAGASIHEVAQVVAAASIIGSGTVAVATTVKLGRVVLLAPVYSLAARRGQDRGAGRQAPLVPLFVIGFALTIALRSIWSMPAAVVSTTGFATTLLLAAGMFGLGLGVRAKDLWPLPLKGLLLATFSTLVAATVSVTLVSWLVD